jgi:hypothetical protein
VEPRHHPTHAPPATDYITFITSLPLLPDPHGAAGRDYFLEAALARSARASRRLNLASSMTPAMLSAPIVEVGYMEDRGRKARKGSIGPAKRLTRISITAEVAGPGDEGMALVLAGGNRVHANGAHH